MILSYRVFNILYISITYDEREFDKIYIHISRVSHSTSQMQDTPCHQIRVFRTLLDATLNSSTLENQLVVMPSFHRETSYSTIMKSVNLHSARQTPLQCWFVLGINFHRSLKELIPFLIEGAYSFLLEEVKLQSRGS